MKEVFQATICLGLVLCVAFHSWAEEDEYLDSLSREESEFRAPLSTEHEGAEIIPSDEPTTVQHNPFYDEEFQAWHSNEAVLEEDLPSETSPPGSVREEQFWTPEVETSTPAERQLPLPPLEGQFPSSSEQSDFSGVAPPPAETPPFMSRPLEWEVTPPTIIDLPPLPSTDAFAGRELVALKFIEEGKSHFDREEWELAREQFERAVSLAPFLPYSYYFLGRIAFAERDLKSALAFLQKAELLFPRTNHAWLGETTSRKGTVYEDLKDYKQARLTYRRSLRFEPANLKVLSALARLPEEELPLSNVFSQ